MKAMRKFITLLLIAASIASTLAACASDDTTTNETTAENADTAEVTEAETTSAEPERLYPDIPDTDWNGENYNVMGRDHETRWFFKTFEVYAESETGDVVNDAIYRRNREIEEKYNVTITQDLKLDPNGELTKLVAAGDDTHDTAFINQLQVAALAQTGTLIDLYSLEHVDFDKPWWNNELNERLSVNNRLYFTTSDFALVDKQRTSLLFFNSDMTEEYSLGNMFEFVRDGLWTIDMMTEKCKVVSRDLNGDGVMDQNDQYGYGCEYYNSSVMAFAADNVICGKDDKDIPILKMNTERWSMTMDKIVKLTADKNVMFFEQDYNGKYEGDYYAMSEDLFKDGRLLFCASFTESFKEMSADCTDEYGVIPFPKYDEAQENYYTLSAQGLVITVPITVSDPSFAGFMLEALSAYSAYTSLPAYIEVSCKTKYMYDENSAEMLDMTFDGLVFDLGQLYNWGDVFNIPYNIGKEGENDFASRYASLESAALAGIEKTVDTYLSLQ